MVPIHLFNIQNFFLILYMCTHLVSKTMSVTLCTHFGFPNFKNILWKSFLKKVMATESFHSKGLKGLATLASGCHSGKFSVCVHILV